MSLLKTAFDYNSHNLSILPVILGDKKPAIPEWTSLQNRLLTQDEIQKFFGHLNGEHGIAIICGKISGNIELMDFDNKFGNIRDTFAEFYNIPEVKEIIEAKKVVIESSPSGGFHLWYRCSKLDGNRKLARKEKFLPDGKKKVEAIIETRGEGGYAVCYPSKGYNLKFGSFDNIPLLTPEERDTLINYAISFNEYTPGKFAEVTVKSPNYTTNSTLKVKPGDAFCNSPEAIQEVRELLKAQGWTFVYARGDNEFWRRPGKNKGVSASFNGVTFYNFSASAHPFDIDKGYSLFQTYAFLKHDGNFSETAKDLLKRGYGQASEDEESKKWFIQTVVDKHGVITFNLDYQLYIQMLSENGFYKYIINNEFILVRKQNNIVDQVQIHDVSNFVQSLVDDEEQLSFLIKNEKTLFTMGKMTFLPTLPDDFNSDTDTQGWLYFKNYAVLVDKNSPDDVELYTYDELPKPIWRNKIIDRNFNERFAADERKCEFEQFLFNICRQNDKKLKLLMSAMGYLLHNFKKQSLTKAVIFCDEKIPENEDDANGGTGKSIVAKYLQMYKNTVTVGGKSSDFKDKFFFQEVSIDTDLLLFDDVGQRFPFFYLFDVITGDLKVQQKNKMPFSIPFRRAPKFLITTNYTIQGTGNSYDRRKLEIEFSSYYNERRTPRDEFGHDLLSEWGADEQARADLFAVKCMKLYLNQGLKDNSSSLTTVRIRQCISETSKDFYEFMMQEIQSEEIKSNIEFNRQKLFEKFKEEFEDMSELKMQTFTKWINKFAMIMKVKIKNRQSERNRYTLFLGDLKTIIAQWSEANSLDL